MVSSLFNENSFIRLTRIPIKQNINQSKENKGKVVRRETEVTQTDHLLGINKTRKRELWYNGYSGSWNPVILPLNNNFCVFRELGIQ